MLATGQMALEELPALRAAALRHTVEVLAREQSSGERRPGRRAVAGVGEEAAVLDLHARAMQQVVLRLLGDRRVEVMAVGDRDRCADLVGRPFRRAPVVRPAAVDGVRERADGLTDGRARIGTVGVDDVEVLESEALECGRHRLHEVLPVERVARVRTVMQPPEELRGHDVLVARPAQALDRLAHDALRLATGVHLSVVEEVHARLARGRHALRRESDVHLVLERHPRAEAQHADLEAAGTQPPHGHRHRSITVCHVIASVRACGKSSLADRSRTRC